MRDDESDRALRARMAARVSPFTMTDLFEIVLIECSPADSIRIVSMGPAHSTVYLSGLGPLRCQRTEKLLREAIPTWYSITVVHEPER